MKGILRLPRPIVKFTLPLLLSVVPFLSELSAPASIIGNHPAVYDGRGMLQPWTSWGDAIDREVNWYFKCPVEHGYPRFVYLTFMDGNYQAIANRPSLIPATQDGMGIISYLKYYAYKGKKDPRPLQMARYMGDYLVKEAITPDTGKYPRFSRSTGWQEKFPQPPDCGSAGRQTVRNSAGQRRHCRLRACFYCSRRRRTKNISNRRCKTRACWRPTCAKGTATNSPWPFRADYRTGEPRGEVSGNMSFILRLFDKLIEHGHPEFKPSRDKLWAWIKTLPDPKPDAGRTALGAVL